MSAGELAFLSLRAVRDLLRKKEVSALELVEAQLARIAGYQPRLNAFITVTAELAREEARRADEARARGEERGPLEGVPITVKDLLWTRGILTTSGSNVDANFVPREDATAVARLRAAGAILLGKTNLHELAYGATNLNSAYGPTRNPWDPERITGGSSGGSAAALAAGIGYGSVGTDTGGSIRIPSALCGTVGLKPTYGRVSRYGVTPLAWSLDHVGPMARSVEDVAILFEILAGPDPKDPTSARRAAGEVVQALRASPRGLRMGVERGYFFDRLDPEVLAAVESAIGSLETMGLERVEVSLPELHRQPSCRNLIAYAEAASYHRPRLRSRASDYSPETREHLRVGLEVRAADYLDAQRVRRALVRRVRQAFDRFDILVSPTLPAPAPRLDEARLSNGEPLRAGLLRLPGPFNTLGLPAMSLPCGFTRGGLPIGLQIAARAFEEPLLLRVAHAYESAHSWRDAHPALDPTA